MTRFLFLLMIAAAPGAFSQSSARIITGTVKLAENYLPVEGAVVAVKNRNYITGTQSDGVFFLDILSRDSSLLVSYEGYQPQVVAITGEKEYNILLTRATGQKTAKTTTTRKSPRVTAFH